MTKESTTPAPPPTDKRITPNNGWLRVAYYDGTLAVYQNNKFANQKDAEEFALMRAKETGYIHYVLKAVAYTQVVPPSEPSVEVRYYDDSPKR